MKTDLNNIWQKCSWRSATKYVSDLYVEHGYFKLQTYKMGFNFFILQQWNTETSPFRKLSWWQ